ncbi:MAG: hypothetical protein ACRC9T_02680 [Vibrionaceae bacterium]
MRPLTFHARMPAAHCRFALKRALQKAYHCELKSSPNYTLGALFIDRYGLELNHFFVDLAQLQLNAEVVSVLISVVSRGYTGEILIGCQFTSKELRGPA